MSANHQPVAKMQGILKKRDPNFPLRANTVRYEGIVAWDMSPNCCSFCRDMRTLFQIRQYLVFPATHRLTCLETGEHKECSLIRSGLTFHELFDHVYLSKLKVAVPRPMQQHLTTDVVLFNELVEFLISSNCNMTESQWQRYQCSSETDAIPWCFRTEPFWDFLDCGIWGILGFCLGFVGFGFWTFRFVNCLGYGFWNLGFFGLVNLEFLDFLDLWCFFCFFMICLYICLIVFMFLLGGIFFVFFVLCILYQDFSSYWTLINPYFSYHIFSLQNQDPSIKSEPHYKSRTPLQNQDREPF